MSSAREVIWEHTSETTWQDHVIQIAKHEGWLVSAMRDSRDLWWGCHPGLPDLILLRSPRVLFVELKAMRGRLTKDQQRWKECLGGCDGVEYYCWRPSDEVEMQRVLA